MSQIKNKDRWGKLSDVVWRSVIVKAGRLVVTAGSAPHVNVTSLPSMLNVASDLRPSASKRYTAPSLLEQQSMISRWQAPSWTILTPSPSVSWNINTARCCIEEDRSQLFFKGPVNPKPLFFGFECGHLSYDCQESNVCHFFTVTEIRP